MKDLITSIGSIMILMVFIMQFSYNQVLATRVLMADAIIDDIQESKEAENMDLVDFKNKIGECFRCEPNEVVINEENHKLTIKMPIKNVIACGEFLGISKEDNESVYVREIPIK